MIQFTQPRITKTCLVELSRRIQATCRIPWRQKLEFKNTGQWRDIAKTIEKFVNVTKLPNLNPTLYWYQSNRTARERKKNDSRVTGIKFLLSSALNGSQNALEMYTVHNEIIFVSEQVKYRIQNHFLWFIFFCFCFNLLAKKKSL